MFQFAIKCDFQYLENDEYYPRETIAELLVLPSNLQVQNEEREEFECDEAPETEKILKTLKITKREAVGMRIASEVNQELFSDPDLYEEQPACSFTEKTIYPQVLNNIYNIPRVIVNQGDFRQQLTQRVCSQVGCFCPASLGHIGKCKQYFQSIKYVYYDKKTSALAIEIFYYPSECRCVQYSPRRKIT